ncbi:MAG: MotA/TolQ/ExbB proton channel family protein [Kiritimatiellaceae bacterium]|nr:MotA/TolQ/ExbB proton channel family protein [Kiritimatiellaceae bacterium]
MDIFSFLQAPMPVASLSDAFWDSTMPGKVIVITLFLGSAMAWTIMWTKHTQLSLASKSTKRFFNTFRDGQSPTAMFARGEELPATPLNTIYQAGCEALGAELQAHGFDPEDVLTDGMVSEMHRRLTHNQLETLRSVVDRNVADEALNLEEQMGMLATAVSAAPFLGLLGTVWGVMDAFTGMAQSGSVALSAVAPGIAGALLTTIVGLVVALPSMIGYNMLSSHIRRISVQMDNFAQEFISEIQNTYVIEA